VFGETTKPRLICRRVAPNLSLDADCYLLKMQKQKWWSWVDFTRINLCFQKAFHRLVQIKEKQLEGFQNLRKLPMIEGLWGVIPTNILQYRVFKK
jgi:hypothetical protein